MTIAELEKIIGGLSNPSKMPGFSYGLPAAECKTGSKLRKVEGSTCSGCYALKGFYTMYKAVIPAQYKRLATITDPRWSDAFIELLQRKYRKLSGNARVFRWHDSGDLQSVEHFANICKVAAATPDIRHWLPTREYRIVADYRKSGGVIPANLTVRLSAHMVGGFAPTFPGLTVSTVSTDPNTFPDAHSCPAPKQDNACGDCRACWNPDVKHVDYHKH
jgi:hypothetical protein